MSHGNRDTIPQRLASHVRNAEIIYWSTPRDDQGICCASFFEMAGPIPLLPCFWPHLVILSPLFCGFAYFARSKALATDVVLTSTTLELLETNGTFTSIALENIKSVTVTTKSQNSCAATCCMPDVNRLIIDDGRMTYGKHGPHPAFTIIMAHDNMDEFRSLILEAKERRSHSPMVMSVMPMQGIPQQMMMMLPQGQQPLVYGQQPMMSGQLLQQQQPMMMYGQSQQQQQPQQQQPIAYGQPMYQPYTYLPSSAPVYPQPEVTPYAAAAPNHAEIEYPKRS